MNELRLLVSFLVLGVAVTAMVSERTPIMRFSYELVNMRGMGKPGRVYG